MIDTHCHVLKEEMANYMMAYKGKSGSACPGVGDYLDAFEGYDEIYVVTIISVLSGSYNALRLALEDHPKLTSFVYDSKILAYPQGEIVIEVSKLIKAGKSFEEIIEEINN